MFYTYILNSLMNNSYYVGSCGNMERRLSAHNSGEVASTKRYMPWKLIHLEEYENLSQAVKRERKIKAWKKRSAIENLIKKSSAILPV